MSQEESSCLLPNNGETSSLTSGKVKKYGTTQGNGVSVASVGTIGPSPIPPIPDEQINVDYCMKRFCQVILGFIAAVLALTYFSESLDVSNSFPAISVANNSGVADIYDHSIGFRSIRHPLRRSDSWGSIHDSYPTGAFWTNLAIESPADQDSLAAAVYPYDVKCKKAGLGVSYSASRRFVRSSSIADMYMDDLVISSQVLGVAAEVISGEYNVGRKYVDRYDNASVTMAFELTETNSVSTTSNRNFSDSSSGESAFHAHLVKGSPFVTTTWDICGGLNPSQTNLRRGLIGDGDIKNPSASNKHRYISPVITSEYSMQSMEPFDPPLQIGREKEQGKTGSTDSSDKFYVVHLNNYQQWLVYTNGFEGVLLLNQSLNTIYMAASHGSLCSSKSPPVIRVAMLPLRNPLAAAAVLAKYAQVYPVAVDMSIDIDAHTTSPSGKGSRKGKLQFNFRTHGGTDADPLLMLALPHHVPLMKTYELAHAHDAQGVRFLSDSVYTPFVFCIKGPMRPVVGRTWVLEYDVAGLQWYYGNQELDNDSEFAADEPLVHGLDLQMQPRSKLLSLEELIPIHTALLRDFREAKMGLEQSSPSPAHASLFDPYEFGKRAGKVARLVLIGDEVLEQYRMRGLQGRDDHDDDDDHHPNSRAIKSMGVGVIRDLQAEAVASLRVSLIPWLTVRSGEASTLDTDVGADSVQGRVPRDPGDVLLYDEVYGGLVPRQGLLSYMADFGAGYYSDHHFHYGYFLFALAVLAKNDESFLREYGDASDMILWDICNLESSSSGDKSGGDSQESTQYRFPYIRHKDFFDGHSWASGGLLQQANGKGQESSSEAASAYYGCYLYSRVSKKPQWQTDVMQLLLAMEVQAAGVYWHMKDDAVYEQLFSGNRMAGNIGSTDVTATTWFGSAVEYVHGINIMPVTPVTALLFADREFAALEWDALVRKSPGLIKKKSHLLGTDLHLDDVPIAACISNMMCMAQNLKEGNCCPAPDGTMLDCCAVHGDVTAEWTSLLYALQAVSNKTAAWSKVLSLMEEQMPLPLSLPSIEESSPSLIAPKSLLGSGNSFSAMLMWVATRPAPLAPISPSVLASNTVTMRPACSENFACAVLGLAGDCCPAISSSKNSIESKESNKVNGTRISTSSSTHAIYLDCCPLV